MTNYELYTSIVCALTHNLDVCDGCKKCGNNCGEVRVKLISELAKALGYPIQLNTEGQEETVNED